MKTKKATQALFLLFAVTWSLRCLSQKYDVNQTTGGVPGALYHGSDIDDVSLSSGNLRIRIPLLSLPGRGLNTDIVLTYNSKIWQTKMRVDPAGYHVWVADVGASANRTPSPGWGLGIPRMGSTPQGWVLCTGGTGPPPDYSCAGSSWYELWVTNEGTQTTLVNDGPPTQTIPTSYWSFDGSYIRLTDGTAYYKDGVTAKTNPQTLEDTNGNVITCTSSGCIDTIGRAINYNYNGDRTLQSVTYQDSSGNTRAISFTYQTYTLYFPYIVDSVPDAQCFDVTHCGVSGGGTFPLLKTVTLPNGVSYGFEYQANADGTTTGEISKLTLPTGGYIRYTYGWTQPDMRDGWPTPIYGQARAVSTRVVSSDGTPGAEKTWTYSISAPTGCSGDNVSSVTDPLGNVQSETQTAGTSVPHKIEFKAPGGTTLKTVNQTVGFSTTTFNDNTNIGFSCPGTSNPRVTSRTTILNDSNQQSQQTFTVSSHGNITSKTESDWSSGSPGAMLRQTVYTYLEDFDPSYADKRLNILDRLRTEVVYDAAATVQAQTSYEYDSYTEGITGSGATQHDSARGSSYTKRGNRTALWRWRNTDGAWLITRNQYDDAGNIRKTTDPNLNSTVFSYVDNFYNYTPSQPTAAYLTQVTLPSTGAVQHIERTQYYFASGLAAASCGQNFPSATSCAFGLPTQPDYTTFTYDLLNRPLATTRADGGQTTLAYNEPALPLSVTASTKITSALNSTTKTAYDGLGRVKQTQLTSDPDGVVFTDTSYDELGRKATVSNPYRSTSEATYGITQFTYDALSRVTRVTNPDATTVTTDYTGFPAVKVTDEAGNARRTYTDGLGRLIRVDEPNGPVTGLPGTATVTINGAEQPPFLGSTQSTATFAVEGTEYNARTCTNGDGSGGCLSWSYIPNSGGVPVAVAGTYYGTGNYGAGSTAITVAADLANSLNSTGIVTASNNGTSTITLRSVARGSSANYSLSYPDPTYGNDSCTPDMIIYYPCFGGSSFDIQSSSRPSAMSGGQDGVTFYDAGTVTITVNGHSSPPVQWGGQGETANAIASRLAAAIHNDSASYEDATANGNVITLTAKRIGGDTNYSLSSSYTFDTVHFSSSSFTTSNGSTLTGGRDSGGLTSPYTTHYIYDVLDNLLCVHQKGTDTTLDKPCNDAGVSAAWRPRVFSYDSLSRLLSASNPESGTINYAYDANGNVISKTSPAPNVQPPSSATQTISYCYDALNRVMKKFYSANPDCVNGSGDVVYTYDLAAVATPPVHNPIGRLVKTNSTATGGNVTTIASYDAVGRTEYEIQYPNRSNSSLSKTFNYSYNFDGSLSSITYPSARVVTYVPNAAQQPTSAADGTNTFASGTHYTAAGALSTTVIGSVNVANFFNARLQPCRIAATAGTSPASCTDSTRTGNVLDLVYDLKVGQADNGNVYGITNKKNASRSQTFQYDDTNRLVSATSANWSNTYGYDPWGNLLSNNATGGDAILNVSVNEKNRAGNNWCYDLAGNIIDPTRSCPTPPPSSYPNVFDAENRMTAATVAGVTTNYDYDAEGRRVKKSNGSTNTLYWYGTGGEVLEETDLSGNLQNEYIFFGGKRITRYSPTYGYVYYFSDHLGSANVVTDASGAIREESDYYPFGGERVATDLGIANNYKFTGKERDPETACDYFGARYYCSNVGRFITPDWAAKAVTVPYANFGNPQSLNLYSYVKNNPTTFGDPDGHDGEGNANDVNDPYFHYTCPGNNCPQQPSCGTGAASICGDIPPNTMGAPGDANAQFTTNDRGEVVCSGNCRDAVAIMAGAEAANNNAEITNTTYTGFVVVNNKGDVSLQPLPSGGNTIDLTVPKPNPELGPTTAVGGGTAFLSGTVNFQNGHVSGVTVSAGPNFGLIKAVDKVNPAGLNAQHQVGDVSTVIRGFQRIGAAVGNFLVKAAAYLPGPSGPI